MHRQMRSWLTMIGIFIGITALVAVVSLGQGLQESINEQFSELGTDKIFVSPGANAFSASSSSIKLTESDWKTIERTPGVRDILGFSYKTAKIEYKDQEHFALVMGITTDEGEAIFHDTWGGYFLKGRMLEKGDNFKAYLAYDYTQDDKVFNKGIKLYNTITINEQQFDVIGFQEKVGNSGDDQTVYITEEAYERTFGVKVSDDYKNLMVRVTEGADINEVAQRLKKNMRNDRGLDVGDEDFSLQTPEELMASFNIVLQIIQVVIVGIAGISLVVGGIGIMNTMYTAVVERTQEIGIMKAIGARNGHIMGIFLIESGLLGAVGGLIGVLIGLGIAKSVEIFGGIYIGSPYLKAWWSWGLIFFSIGFSFFVGMFAGTAPAWQASKQKPVDSLRYE